MPSATVNNYRPTDLLSRLVSDEPEVKVRALREVKNQIIGNRTKKLSFLKIGAVPAVAGILADSTGDLIDNNCSNNNINNILVQSAAVLGSFACGFDAGVQAVLDAGALPNLLRLLANSNEKRSKMVVKHQCLLGRVEGAWCPLSKVSSSSIVNGENSIRRAPRIGSDRSSTPDLSRLKVAFGYQGISTKKNGGKKKYFNAEYI